MLRVAAVALLLAGCSMIGQISGGLAGAGQVKTETRQVDSFERVDFNGGVRFNLTVGQPTSVTITAQENLLPITTTTVANGTLTVTTTQNYVSSQGITVTVSTPTLTAVTVDGGVLGNAGAVSATDFAIDADGGANLTIGGTCTSLSLSVNGGARVNGTGLSATNATVDINGGASATVAVSGSATGTANGGASLNLLGNPASVNVTTNGGASVSH